jgi:hypothetical protein
MPNVWHWMRQYVNKEDRQKGRMKHEKEGYIAIPSRGFALLPTTLHYRKSSVPIDFIFLAKPAYSRILALRPHYTRLF